MQSLLLDNDKIFISIGKTSADKKEFVHIDHGSLIDLIIIGAGPAGITAAIYSTRKKLKTLLISKDLGGQASISSSIENYPGFQIITGPLLTSKLDDHLRTFDLDLHLAEECKAVQKRGNLVSVITDKAGYLSKACIICSGATPKKLHIQGEQEFWGRGISTCSICDSPLYSGKDVAVIGGGNSALDTALQLSQFSKKVYIINKNTQFKGDGILIEKVIANERIIPIYGAQAIAFLGKESVEGIHIVEEGKEKTLDVGGVFIEVGYKPNSNIIDTVEKNSYGEIMVSKKNETTIAGIYAAGDVTDIPTKQIVVAAGEGAKAAVWSSEYILKTRW
jgi:alkyl hydroperoxide reductase subunit F